MLFNSCSFYELKLPRQIGPHDAWARLPEVGDFSKSEGTRCNHSWLTTLCASSTPSGTLLRGVADIVDIPVPTCASHSPWSTPGLELEGKVAVALVQACV